MHSFVRPGLIIDIARDIRALNELSRHSKRAGMILVGGGVAKHQIANAMAFVSEHRRRMDNLLTSSQRGGADYSVYIVRV